MKFFKKAMGLVLAATMAVSMAACSSADTTEPPADTTAETTGEEAAASPEEVMQTAKAKLQEITSVESELSSTVSMSMDGQSLDIKNSMTMVSFTDPLKLKIETSTDLGQMGAQDIDMYVGEENGKTMMYMNVNGTWIKREVPQEELVAYDTQESVVVYLENSVNLKEAGQEQINGAEATKYEGIITQDSLQETMKQTSAMESLEAMLAGTDMNAADLYEGLEDVTISIWIDAEGYPVKCEMDMTQMMEGFMRKVVQATGVSEQEAEAFQVGQAVVTVTNKSFNNATDFEIPQEALSAAEASF